MFSCRVCVEKEKRIDELKSQVEMLRSLVSPAVPSRSVPLVHVESDAILSARDEPVLLNKDQTKELDRIESEATKILTGNYDS
jgi:hypothetical protein